jgi:hypothetical protein
LLADQAFAPLDKVFPLGPSAIYGIAPAIDVLTCLILATVNQRTDLFSHLLATGAQVLGAVPGAACEVVAGFASALGCIQNANQSAYAQARKKPRKSIDSAVFSHNKTSPFTMPDDDPDECLRVSESPSIQQTCRGQVNTAQNTKKRRSGGLRFFISSGHWTHPGRDELQGCTLPSHAGPIIADAKKRLSVPE